MGPLLYYIVIKPVSLLPFWFLYWISDLLYFLIYKVFKYRYKVVKDNIELVFSDQESDFQEDIIKGFYQHLCDIIVESLKGFSLSNEELLKRYRFIGAEKLDKYYEDGKDVILASGHYCNWEWAAFAAPLFFQHQCVVIYTPLSNKFIDKKMQESRGRNGFVLVPQRQVKSYMQNENKKPELYFFVVDQSPSNPKRAYWTDFMGVHTPIQFGVEKYSKEMAMPVFFIHLNRVKRGYYTLEINKVTDTPEKESHGQIITKTYRHLEQMIAQNPAWWLWSHRRWKHIQKK